MLTITTWHDIILDQDHINPDLHLLITSRFKQLYTLFCTDNSIPLEQFSLKKYGAINIVESYSEIEGKTFELVMKFKIHQTIVYVAAYLTNNEVCSDFYIPAGILNPEQINALEKEL